MHPSTISEDLWILIVIFHSSPLKRAIVVTTFDSIKWYIVSEKKNPAGST